jgi:hypothetical protein
VGFLISCFFLFHGLQKAVEEVRAVEDKANQSMAGGRQLELLVESMFDAPRVITDPKIEIQIAGVAGRGSLMFPDNFIRCASVECARLIPYETTVCPFCGQKQPEEAYKPAPGEDTDEDGLPNQFEADHAFLDPYDPTDAAQDQDQDGFTNLEEYLAKTALDDPKSYPPLASLLRVEGIQRNVIPIMLAKIARNNSDDPAMWDIQCDVIERGQRRKKSFRLGAKVAGYELIDVNYKVEPQYDRVRKRKVEIDRSQLTLKAEATEDTYVLDVGKVAHEKDSIVKFFYLNNRYNPRRCQRFEARLGEKFPLTHAASGDTQHYTVAEVTATSIVVRRTDENVDEQDFDVRKLDVRNDFLRRPVGGAAEGQPAPDMR